MCFYGVGVSGFEFKWGSFEFAKAEPFNEDESLDSSLDHYAPVGTAGLASQDRTKVKADSTPKKILLIGDSMAEGLMARLLDYADASGHRLRTVSWYGSGTRQYGRSDTLAYFIRNFKPDFVIVSLGTNEMEIPHIGRQHREYVHRILSQLGNTPFVWVGPPLVGHDTGMNDLIAHMVGQGRFFSSVALNMPRQADGIHPTRPGFGVWVDTLARWVQNQSQNPILLRAPKRAKLHLKPDVVVLRQS